jgi:hypothetical protein
MQTVDGRLVVVGGGSRSGKTAFVRQEVQHARRVFAWDPEDQWAQLPGWIRVTRRADLMKAATKKGPAKVAFVTGGDLKEAFQFWCDAVFHSTRYVEPTDAVAEELSDVTNSSKAPGSWGILLRRGLKRGGNIYAISQRWQEADKTAMGNATEFVLFRQNGKRAPAYLSRETGIPPEAIPKLPLHYVRFDPATDAMQTGVLTFSKDSREPAKKNSRKSASD